MTADPAKAEESEKLVATEMWEDEPFEKTEIKKVIEELEITKMKLTARLTEAEPAIDNLNAKISQVEKTKTKIACESSDMANSLD